MNLLKKFAIATTAAMPVLGLAGCAKPVIDLCSYSQESPMIGTPSMAQVYKDADHESRVCIINGSDLREAKHYGFHGGLLIVDGDVPVQTQINVVDGKLFIAGDIGADTRITASVPEILQIHTGLSIVTFLPEVYDTFEGFVHESDQDAAIVIVGDIGKNAFIISNHDVNVRDASGLAAIFKNSRPESEYNWHVDHSGNFDNYQIAPIVAAANLQYIK